MFEDEGCDIDEPSLEETVVNEDVEVLTEIVEDSAEGYLKKVVTNLRQKLAGKDGAIRMQIAKINKLKKYCIIEIKRL